MSISAAEETAYRDKIIKQAEWHLTNWGGEWNPVVDKVSTDKHKVAGKLCADQATRSRQGGILISTVFQVAGHPHANRCLTISEAAVKMYNRPEGYSPSERNNTDICSWCGIFALYIYKMAGMNKMPAWPFSVYKISTEKSPPGSDLPPKLRARELYQFEATAKPTRGDIGVIGAREVRDKSGKVTIKVGQNHHFIITKVEGARVYTIDGNAGNLMEIVDNDYSISSVMQTGGFYTPIWENCL